MARRRPAARPGQREGRSAPPDRAGGMNAPDRNGGSLAAELAALVGPSHVRIAPAERAAYAMDGLPTHRRVPGVVVLPGTRDEVIAVVRLLAPRGVAFVPRGAGTGLSGGPLAEPQPVPLVLPLLTPTLKIHPLHR